MWHLKNEESDNSDDDISAKKEAIDEQEKLLEEQSKALAALKKLKSDRLRFGFKLLAWV